jgi:hypothetical protein
MIRKKGGLAAARRPQQGKKFPRRHVQGHVVQGVDIAKLFTDMFNAEAFVTVGILVLIHILERPDAQFLIIWVGSLIRKKLKRSIHLSGHRQKVLPSCGEND